MATETSIQNHLSSAPDGGQAPKKRIRASVACNNCRIKRSKEMRWDSWWGSLFSVLKAQPLLRNAKGWQTTEVPILSIQMRLYLTDLNDYRSSAKAQVETLTERVQSLERSLVLSKAEASHNPRPMYDDYSQGLPFKAVESQISVGVNSPHAFLPSDDIFNNGTDIFGLPSDGSDGENLPIDFFGAQSFDPNSSYDLVPPFTCAPHCPPKLSSKTSLRQIHSLDRTPDTDYSRDSRRIPNTTNLTNTFDAVSSIEPEEDLHGVPRRPCSDIPEAVVNHLLDLYFRRFQILMEIVPEKEFMEQMRLGYGPAYRESLLFAVLAAGSRYSSNIEHTAPYMLPNGDNLLVQRSTHLLESELQDCNITTVQALLILGELQTSAGNDMTGCSLVAMASKLIFDLGLDLGNSRSDSLSETDIRIRHWILWCASVQDKYWALALERPLSIKNHDLQVSRLAARFARSSNISSSTLRPEEQVHESVLDLMELAREVTDSLYGSEKFPITLSGYATMARLDKRLQQWFASLPEIVKTGPAADKNPLLFIFVLHMQFHSTRILLQQRFAFPTSAEMAADEASSHPILAHTSKAARSVCVTSAIRVAKLFETFRRKYDVRSIQCTGTQYAAFAANALVKHISSLPPDEAIEPIAHVQSLSRTLQDMSKTFLPALKPLEMINRELDRFSKSIEWFDHDDSISIPYPRRAQHPHSQVTLKPFDPKSAEMTSCEDRYWSSTKRRPNTREILNFHSPSNSSPPSAADIMAHSPPSLSTNAMKWASRKTHHETSEWNTVKELNVNNVSTVGRLILDSPEDGNTSLDGWEELLITS